MSKLPFIGFLWRKSNASRLQLLSNVLRSPVVRSLRIGDVPIVGPKGAARIVSQPGPLDACLRDRVHAYLADRLRAAA